MADDIAKTLRDAAQAIINQTRREGAEIAHDQCIGRQTSDDEGSTRWLEAGKCARQSRDAILALIPKDQVL